METDIQRFVGIVNAIREKIDVPKTEYNKFGNFYYRTVEGILQGVKPFLKEHNCLLDIKDELVLIGDRYYVKAMTTLSHPETGGIIETIGFAREAETKPGMDLAQLSASTSTHARKLALNALFLLDDVKDLDHPREKNHPKKTPQKEVTDESIYKQIELASSLEELKLIWDTYPQLRTNQSYKEYVTRRKKELTEK